MPRPVYLGSYVLTGPNSHSSYLADCIAAWTVPPWPQAIVRFGPFSLYRHPEPAPADPGQGIQGSEWRTPKPGP